MAELAQAADVYAPRTLPAWRSLLNWLVFFFQIFVQMVRGTPSLSQVLSYVGLRNSSFLSSTPQFKPLAIIELPESQLPEEAPQQSPVTVSTLQMTGEQRLTIFVELDDFRRARPDAIVHSAGKIISRLKAAGEKTMQALRSLCWRCKGIQVEEVSLIGVDSLGFDLRVCSGTQVQTLRFSFRKRASSEYSAERQLNDLLFPRIHHKSRQKKESQQAES